MIALSKESLLPNANCKLLVANYLCEHVIRSRKNCKHL